MIKVIHHESQEAARKAAELACKQDDFATFCMVTEGYLVVSRFRQPVYHKCSMHEYGADH